MAEPIADARIALPEGAEAPVRVYINGEELSEGPDFAVEEGQVRILRTVRPRPDLGVGRKIMLAIGIGVYGDLKGDVIDVHFRRRGRPEALTGMRLRSPEAAARPGPGG